MEPKCVTSLYAWARGGLCFCLGGQAPHDPCPRLVCLVLAAGCPVPQVLQSQSRPRPEPELCLQSWLCYLASQERRRVRKILTGLVTFKWAAAIPSTVPFPSEAEQQCPDNLILSTGHQKAIWPALLRSREPGRSEVWFVGSGVSMLFL